MLTRFATLAALLAARAAHAAEVVLHSDSPNVLVWKNGDSYSEAMSLLAANVEKAHPELLVVLLACRAPDGSKAIVTSGGFFSSEILVTSGRSAGCRGTIGNSLIAH